MTDAAAPAQPDLPPLRHGGKILADQLAILGADTVFCVPGESFLGLLDGLHDHANQIRTVACRHEGGATNMAEAHGKLTGKPGIAAVTRGPGATNGCNGLHTGFQDSTPMILFVGQVSREHFGREAFQDADQKWTVGDVGASWGLLGPVGASEVGSDGPLEHSPASKEQRRTEHARSCRAKTGKSGQVWADWRRRAPLEHRPASSE